MTPILGLVIAVIAGRLAPNLRALLLAVVALLVAATAVQTWDLGEGLGKNPPSTIREASYWVVQVIVLAITLAVAYGCFALRRRKADRRGASLLRPNFTGRKGVLTTSLLGTLMVVVGIAFCLIAGAMRTRTGTGSGDIPWTGVAGITVAVLLLLALAIAFLRDNRGMRSAEASRPVATRSSS
jgi:hypothetical protein